MVRLFDVLRSDIAMNKGYEISIPPNISTITLLKVEPFIKISVTNRDKQIVIKK